jgi:hypothetical protein
MTEIDPIEALRVYALIMIGDGTVVELPEDPHEAARRYAEVVGADGPEIGLRDT